MNFLKKIISKVFIRLESWSKEYKNYKLRLNNDIHPEARIDGVEIIGFAKIGKGTYINPGSLISTGEKSKVIIGQYCAIGRYVHISSKTHDLKKPTATKESAHLQKEADVIIGNNVWIGDKVFIKEGVKIEDYAVIGANSVVTKDVKKFEIVGGVPAKNIRFNTLNQNYTKER